jgi:hypothetical protein
MKIVIDKDAPDLTEAEIEEIKERDIPVIEQNPEEFRRQMEGVDTVVIPEQVRKQLEEAGMTPDDIVAMLLRAAGKMN